jgi:hypothetical protein
MGPFRVNATLTRTGGGEAGVELLDPPQAASANAASALATPAIPVRDFLLPIEIT